MRDRAKIDWQNLTDDEFITKAEIQIWLSAFANNNPRAPAHEEADKAYVEAQRREKPWLYTKAYNSAYVSCGFSLSDDDRERATEAYWVAKKAEEDAA